MREQATKIQIVINTLETLNIPPTFDNVNHMYGIYKMLYSVRDELNKPVVEPEKEAEPDGV